MRSAKAVLFDVDFTLIYPGPTFRGEGYQAFCARYSMEVDPRSSSRVSSARRRSSTARTMPTMPEIFIAYTSHIIEQMGGRGPRRRRVLPGDLREWAACQHFELYDDVPAVLQQLSAAGLRIGLISNTHRCLASFQSHFELQGLISATVSSSEHGFMKPHPSIFSSALQLRGRRAAEAVMVGDSVRQDIEGALESGMRAMLLHRGDTAAPAVVGDHRVPVIRSLRELPDLVIG